MLLGDVVTAIDERDELLAEVLPKVTNHNGVVHNSGDCAYCDYGRAFADKVHNLVRGSRFEVK